MSTTTNLNELLKEYEEFHALVERTPRYHLMIEEAGNLAPVVDPRQQHTFIRQFHAVMGMAGEAGEVLDIYKKRLFGKNKPIDASVVRLELGDLWWYFFLFCRASGIPFEDILRENIVKLRERYLK